MFVLVQHNVKDPSGFVAAAAASAPHIPAGLTLHHSFSAPNGSHAVCIWEAASIDALRDFLEPALAGFSRNEYFEVLNKEGIVMPQGLISA